MSSFNKMDEVEIVLRPFKHVRKIKLQPANILPLFVKGLNQWLELPEDIYHRLKAIIMSLLDLVNLLDDIQDNAILRRAIPSGYLIYGISQSVYSCLLAMSVALERMYLFENHNLKLIDTYISLGLYTICGQMLEDHYRKNYQCPTVEEFMELITIKAGMSVGQSMELFKSCSNFGKDITGLVRNFGMLLQMCNDYTSIKSSRYWSRKSCCEDISAGVFTLPVVHAMRTNPQDKRLLEILKNRTKNLAEMKLAIDIIEACGSLDYVKQKILQLLEKIKIEIKLIGDNKDLEEILSYFVANLGNDAFYD